MPDMKPAGVETPEPGYCPTCLCYCGNENEPEQVCSVCATDRDLEAPDEMVERDARLALVPCKNAEDDPNNGIRDFVLRRNSCWIEVNNVVIHIQRLPGGVAIRTFPSHDLDVDPLSYAYTEFSACALSPRRPSAHEQIETLAAVIEEKFVACKQELTILRGSMVSQMAIVSEFMQDTADAYEQQRSVIGGLRLRDDVTNADRDHLATVKARMDEAIRLVLDDESFVIKTAY
jgi:hypothetical protein